MGSVIDYMDCPNCHSEETFMTDFYYKTGEEFALCTECGCTHSHFIKRDNDGVPVLQNPDKPNSFDNIVYETSEAHSPFGAYSLRYKNMKAGQIGTLLNMNEYNTFKSYCSFNKDTIEKAIVSRLIKGTIVKETLHAV